ncbi:hypothetical protein Ae201684P_008803 [Aphanomyces euteiches]|nr:hypothetical protein Ae201684P_008803 [Aphanomyces euteiches]
MVSSARKDVLRASFTVRALRDSPCAHGVADFSECHIVAATQRQTNLVVLELMDESLFCLKERSRQNSKNHNNGGFKTIQEYAHSALSLSYKCGNKLESELPADGDWRQLGRAWNRDEPYFVSVYWQLS